MIKLALLAIIAVAGAVICWLKTFYGREAAQRKKQEEFDKKRAELKAILMRIDDVKKILNDEINLNNTTLVNELSLVLTGLCARRDDLNAELSGKL